METMTLLAEGLLSWSRYERVGDRYGTVTIQTAGGQPDYDSLLLMGDALPEGSTWSRFEGAPVGKRGRLVAEVVETRESGHIGDIFRGFRPSTPEVGERIILGEGTLIVEDVEGFGGGRAVGLIPDDGREVDWLDGPSLYRCHDQTVRLFFEEA